MGLGFLQSSLEANLVHLYLSITFPLPSLIIMQKGAENNKTCILFPWNIIYQAVSLETQE